MIDLTTIDPVRFTYSLLAAMFLLWAGRRVYAIFKGDN